MSKTRIICASTSHYPHSAAFLYIYPIRDTTNDATHSTSFQVDTSTTDTTERPFVCSGDYKCQTYCTVFCCFLRPTANCRKENVSCGLQLNCTSHCKLLASRFQPAALVLCSCRSLFETSTPYQRLVNLSLANSPYRKCCDIRLIFK